MGCGTTKAYCTNWVLLLVLLAGFYFSDVPQHRPPAASHLVVLEMRREQRVGLGRVGAQREQVLPHARAHLHAASGRAERIGAAPAEMLACVWRKRHGQVLALQERRERHQTSLDRTRQRRAEDLSRVGRQGAEDESEG